jgi:putative lumazine-binding protein
MTPHHHSFSAIALLGLLLAAPGVRAQASADSAGIRAAALDYIQGWYSGDATRMQRALHPKLAKRIVETDPASHQSVLGDMGAEKLVEYTRSGGGGKTPPDRRQADVSILDIYQGAASAKVIAADWIDYLHLARWNGRWVIVNVLWEFKPKSERSTR